MYQPMEIIVRRPDNYVGNGNYMQKITIITEKTEKDLMESINKLEDICAYRIFRVTDGDTNEIN